jgi:hypothetical protein
MVEAGRELNPPDLRVLGVKVRDLLDTDGPEPAEDAAYEQETLQLRKTDHGVTFTGRLANENAELLQTLIFDNAKPHKTVDGGRDPRSKGRRQSDALTTVLSAAAGSGVTGNGAVKPHISVTIDYNDLVAALTTNTGPLAGTGANGTGPAGNAGSGSNGTASGNGGTAGNGTASGLGLLAGTTGTGDLVYGDRLSASAVRRLACDAGILPIVLGSDSRPLDVGTEQRFVTDAMRLALNARDKGCVICGAPPIQCDAHHIVHWALGGPTSLDNLVLMCKHDHRDTHHGYWDVAITDGVVRVTRPGWADPAPARLRHPRPAKPPPPPAAAAAAEPRPGTPPGPASARGPGSPGTADPADPAEAADPCWPDDPLPPTTIAARSPSPVRAWPHTGDTTWTTPDETARLNPWGDDPDQAPTSAQTPTRTPTDPATWTSPWGDEPDNSAPGP